MGAMPSGGSEKLELGRGVFAIEQVYPTKARAEGFFESHQRYIDVQVIVEGEELMEVIDIGRISPREPWDAARDLAIYQDAPHASKLHLLPNEAAIFFPSDVHMPSLRVTSAPALVRKSVIKVPVA